MEHLLRYRVEIGWGDADQALVAFVEAPTEAAAQRLGSALVRQVRVLRIDTAGRMAPAAGLAVESVAEIEKVSGAPDALPASDHSRWMRPKTT